jgi:hypothetical protein
MLRAVVCMGGNLGVDVQLYECLCVSYQFSKYLTNVHNTCHVIKNQRLSFSLLHRYKQYGERAKLWEGSDMMTISFEV